MDKVPMTRAGFLECLFCGSHRLCLRDVEQEETPPTLTIVIECLACAHHFTLDIAQATEQVHLGFFGGECPESCQQKQAHEKI